MLKIYDASAMTPVGYFDPIGVGRGWQYVVYNAPSIQDAYVVPNFNIAPDGSLPPDGFFKVAKNQRVIHRDFGIFDLTPQSIESAWLVAYVAPDGTLFCGTSDEVAAAVGASLRANPDMWAQSPLGRLEMTQYAKADDLLHEALADAYAFMCTFPKNSGRMWAESSVSEAVLPMAADLLADLDRKAVRDAYRVHVQDARMWLVVNPALAERMTQDGHGIADTVSRYAEAFGIAYQGLVVVSDAPWRWRPAGSEEVLSNPAEDETEGFTLRP